jgi:hypothetical protein
LDTRWLRIYGVSDTYPYQIPIQRISATLVTYPCFIECKGYRCWGPVSSSHSVSHDATFNESRPFFSDAHSSHESINFLDLVWASSDALSTVSLHLSSVSFTTSHLCLMSLHAPSSPFLSLPPIAMLFILSGSLLWPRRLLLLSVPTLGILSLALPPSTVPITCKFVYKIKTGSDGSIHRYKTCLVVCGFQQQYCCDYEETFAPVAHRTTIHTLVAVASVRRWAISS